MKTSVALLVSAAALAGAGMVTAAEAAPAPAGQAVAPAGEPVRSIQTAEAAVPDVAAHRALLDRYCVTCHNQDTVDGRGRAASPLVGQLRAAGLTLDTLDLADVGGHADAWEKVVRKLRGGVMPPAGRPRPAAAALEAFLTWLEGELDRAWAVTRDPGRTATFHRLNRTEYRNAIRDLLAVEIDAVDYLPADDSSFGFDNIGGVLKMSQSLMERYLAAARSISRLAVGSPPPAVSADTYEAAQDLPQHRPRRGVALRDARRPLHRASVSAGCRVRRPGGADRLAPAPREPRPGGDARRRAGGAGDARPAAGRRAGQSVRAGLHPRFPPAGQRRPARGRGHLLQEAVRPGRAGPRAVPESARGRQPRRSGRAAAVRAQRDDHRSVRRLRRDGHPVAGAHLHVPPAGRRRGVFVRARYPVGAGAARLSASGLRRRAAGAARTSTRRAAAAAASRTVSSWPSGACSSAPSSSIVSRPTRPGWRPARRTASAIWISPRGCRSSSGAAFRTTSCSPPPSRAG